MENLKEIIENVINYKELNVRIPKNDEDVERLEKCMLSLDRKGLIVRMLKNNLRELGNDSEICIKAMSALECYENMLEFGYSRIESCVGNYRLEKEVNEGKIKTELEWQKANGNYVSWPLRCAMSNEDTIKEILNSNKEALNILDSAKEVVERLYKEPYSFKFKEDLGKIVKSAKIEKKATISQL